MKKVLLLLSVLLIGCTAYQPITSVDPIYGYTTNTIENEFELQRLLRTDFKFRYDFAQFAMRQPLTWQWSNRISPYRVNRYNYWNPYSPMDRTQMWNDWLWGFNGWDSWGSPHRWSPFGYDRWGYGIHYGWNNHGWGYNGYYGNSWYWRTQMNRFAWQNRDRNNTVNVNGRRSSTMSNRDRIGQASMIESTKRRTNTNIKPIITPTRPVNNRPTINRPPTINRNNRPVINRNTTSPNRRTITPTKTNTTTKRRGN
jgi:hypothetical protein